MEKVFTRHCKAILAEKHLNETVGNQKEFFYKRVDTWIGPLSNPHIVELKIYHDKADWKATRTSTNTVETDLNFVKGKDNAWAGIIDTIPSTSRQPLPYDLRWQEIEIDEDVFKKYYESKHPKSSPPRERMQKTLFVNGLEF